MHGCFIIYVLLASTLYVSVFSVSEFSLLHIIFIVCAELRKRDKDWPMKRYECLSIPPYKLSAVLYLPCITPSLLLCSFSARFIILFFWPVLSLAPARPPLKSFAGVWWQNWSPYFCLKLAAPCISSVLSSFPSLFFSFRAVLMK